MLNYKTSLVIKSHLIIYNSGVVPAASQLQGLYSLILSSVHSVLCTYEFLFVHWFPLTSQNYTGVWTDCDKLSLCVREREVGYEYPCRVYSCFTPASAMTLTKTENECINVCVNLKNIISRFLLRQPLVSLKICYQSDLPITRVCPLRAR